MSTIHLHQTTTATPEQFLAALIDFGPGRSKVFGNSADDYLKVHHRGPSDADVTEGSCSGPSASAFWRKRLETPSGPSKPATVTTERHHTRTDGAVTLGRKGHGGLRPRNRRDTREN